MGLNVGNEQEVGDRMICTKVQNRHRVQEECVVVGVCETDGIRRIKVSGWQSYVCEPPQSASLTFRANLRTLSISSGKMSSRSA